MSGDTILFLVVAVIFILFILPRLSSMMSGNTGTTGYPQGNTPNNNGTLGGNDRPTYDSTDVESHGSIGQDRGPAAVEAFCRAPLVGQVRQAVRASSVHLPAAAGAL